MFRLTSSSHYQAYHNILTFFLIDALSFGPLNKCLPTVPIQYTLLPILDPHCLQILSLVIFPSDFRPSYWSRGK
jgi:hypothetical protein